MRVAESCHPLDPEFPVVPVDQLVRAALLDLLAPEDRLALAW